MPRSIKLNNPKSLSPKKKIILAVLILIAVAALIVFIISLKSAFDNSAEKHESEKMETVAKTYVSSMIDYNMDNYWLSLSSLEYGGVEFEKRYEILGNDYDAYVGIISSAAESKTGKIKEIKTEIKNKTALSEEEITYIYNTYSYESAVLTREDISNAKRFDAVVTVIGEDGEITLEFNKLVAIKEKGEWKIFSLEVEFDKDTLLN